MAGLTLDDRNRLKALLRQYFSAADFRDVVDSLGVVYEDLAGETRRDRMASLIRYSEDHGRLPALLAELRQRRPAVQWPALTEDAPAITATGAFPARLDLDFEQRQALIDALLACPSLGDRHRRDQVVEQLPSAIRGNIDRSNADRYDVAAIVKTCLDYESGLARLLAVVRAYEQNSRPVQQLEALVESFRP